MCSASKQVHKKPEGRISGTGDLNEPAKGIFHTTEHPSQYRNGKAVDWELSITAGG